MQKKKFSKRNKNYNRTNFFSFNTKIAFKKLKQAFIIALIFCYISQKCYISIKTNTSNHIISQILN